MALNSVIKETGIESGVAFGVGTLINSFISDDSTDFSRTFVEVGLALVANGLAANAYLDYARSKGSDEVLNMVPFVLVLGATQPKLLSKLGFLSNTANASVQRLIAHPIQTFNPTDPAANANKTEIVNTKVPLWAKRSNF